MTQKIIIKDYSSTYGELVTFNTNNNRSHHRWYPLVEGFSFEFVRAIIGEQEKLPKTCLDPFGGVGTTALTCQELGIKCHTIESNPFFYEVSRTKLRNDYASPVILKFIETLVLASNRKPLAVNLPNLESETFFESNNRSKWLLDSEVAYAIQEIINLIDLNFQNEVKYSKLFKVGLSNLLVPMSNVFRNGKCLSYRKGWKENSFSRKDVFNRFIEYCRNVILIDIRTSMQENRITNFLNVEFGDARDKIKEIEDNSLDLVITSPPYLNSRDYTDIYRLELWMLGYVTNFEQEKVIRKSALTSHVQVELKDYELLDNRKLASFVSHLNNLNGSLWNKNIPNMIKGYFSDMHELLLEINKKLRTGGKVYLNVSNSAYGNEICYVDEILFEIAESLGFLGIEIREARKINSSRQQKLPEKLRESVIVLKKV
ncbi:MAG: hypothetical protein RLN81_07475 [Balneolaceae bacterium]